MNGPLTLDEVPESMLTEMGLSRGCFAMRDSVRCADSAAVLIPVSEIAPWPGRKLNEERLRSVLRYIVDDSLFPEAVQVFRLPHATGAHLIHGMHRLRAAQAVGLRYLPCIELEAWELRPEILKEILGSNMSSDSTTEKP